MRVLTLAGLVLCATPALAVTKETVDARRPCQNMASFRAWALTRVPSGERNAVQRWMPPQPVRSSEQATIAKLAARYMEQCGADEVVALTGALVGFGTVNTAVTGKQTKEFHDAAEYLRHWSVNANLLFSISEDGNVYEIGLGTGERHQLWVGHLDVVAGGDGWRTNPHRMVESGGRLIGRGVEDDKGAVAAALVALRVIAAMGLQPMGTLAVALGTDGERGGDLMQAYADSRSDTPAVIAIDTVFPIGVAEPGVGFWRLRAPMMGASTKPLRPVAVTAVSGNLTQHPEVGSGAASLTLRPSPSQSVSSLMDAAIVVGTQVTAALRQADPTLRVDVHPDRANTVTLDVHGRPAYDPAQDNVSNVLWVLGQVAARLQVAPNGVGALLQVIDGFFANRPMPMGNLYMVPTALSIQQDVCELQLYLRLPYGTDEGVARQTLATALKRMQAINPYIGESAPPTFRSGWISRARNDVTDTLAAVYEKHVGEKPHLVPMPNDSYARLFRQGVGFGPLLPGQPRTAHGPNESMAKSDLKQFAEMVMHVMLRLEFGYQ